MANGNTTEPGGASPASRKVGAAAMALMDAIAERGPGEMGLERIVIAAWTAAPEAGERSLLILSSEDHDGDYHGGSLDADLLLKAAVAIEAGLGEAEEGRA